MIALRALAALAPRRRRFVLATYSLVLLGLTLAPLPASAGRLPDWFDKVVHFGLFTGFTAFLFWTLSGSRRPRGLPVVGAGVALAGAIELVQGLEAFRSGDLWDFVWGSLGSVVGWLVVRALQSVVSSP